MRCIKTRLRYGLSEGSIFKVQSSQTRDAKSADSLLLGKFITTDVSLPLGLPHQSKSCQMLIRIFPSLACLYVAGSSLPYLEPFLVVKMVPLIRMNGNQTIVRVSKQEVTECNPHIFPRELINPARNVRIALALTFTGYSAVETNV